MAKRHVVVLACAGPTRRADHLPIRAENEEANDVIADPAGELLVATLPKNSREEIQVRCREYEGIPLVDVRVFTKPAVPGEPAKPTKKGLSLRPETWRELLPHLAVALGDGAGPEPEGEGANDGADPFGDE